MVVLPTAKHVSLHYGWTPVDLAGVGLSLVGAVGVVALAWADRRAPVVPEPDPAPPEPVPAPRPSRPAAQPAKRARRSRSRNRR
jgi:hypothetical protein